MRSNPSRRPALPALAALVLAALVLVAACGDEPEPAPRPGEDSLESSLSRIRRTGKLLVGISGDLPLFGFTIEEGGEPEGFEVDIVRTLASYLNAEPEFVVLLPSERLSAAAAGRVDIVAAGLEQTFQREDAVDFSLAVFMDGQKLLARKGSGIRGPADLSGRAVGVAKGAGDAKRLKKANPDTEVISYSDYIKAFLALKSGEVQALSADATVLLKLRAADVDPGLWEIVGPYLSRRPYALALPENQSDFRDVINKGLARLWLSGDYLRIYEKWFGPDTRYPLPLDFQIEVWPGAGD